MLIPRSQCQDFQVAFKMDLINSHNNVAKKLKNYSSKQNWVREKHLNKQTAQKFQGLINVY